MSFHLATAGWHLHRETMPAGRFAQEIEAKKKMRAQREEQYRVEQQDKLKSMAARKLQSIVRGLIARKRYEELRRPLTPAELLARRREVFMADRAASRRPGYASHMLSDKVRERERSKVLEMRIMRSLESHYNSLLEREPTSGFEAACQRLLAKQRSMLNRTILEPTSESANSSPSVSPIMSRRFQGLSRRQQSLAHDGSQASPASSPDSGAHSFSRRIRKVSKEVMGAARSASLASTDALKVLLSA